MAPLSSVTIISSPYHVGIRDQAVGAGPTCLLKAGLVSSLRGQGLDVFEVALAHVDEFDGEIARSFEVLRRTSAAVTDALDAGTFPIILAGNCCATVGVAAGVCASKEFASKKATPGCVWFDAHDDFNTPDSVLGGYFDSMGIAMMVGLCWKVLLSTIPGFRPLDLNRVIQCGMRDVTELERARVTEAGLSIVWGDAERKVDFESELRTALEQRNLGPTVVHVDLDALDKSVGQVNKFSAPGGLLEEELIACMRMIPTKSQPLCLTIASYDPSFDHEGKIPPIAIKAVVSLLKGLKSG